MNKVLQRTPSDAAEDKLQRYLYSLANQNCDFNYQIYQEIRP